MSEEIKFSKLSCPNHFGEETQCCKEIERLKKDLEKAVVLLRCSYTGFGIPAEYKTEIEEFLSQHDKEK